MQFCRTNTVPKLQKSEENFQEMVNFGYDTSSKEDFEPIKIYLDQMKENRKLLPSGNLTWEEENELFKRIENQDIEAEGIIITRFLNVVPRLARYYSGNGVAIEDLIQEGNIALMEAIHKFDNYRGYRFSTFLKYMIRNRFRRCIPFYLTSFDIPIDSLSTIKKVNEGCLERKSEYKLKNVLYSQSLDEFENEILASMYDISAIPFEEELTNKVTLSSLIRDTFDNLTTREQGVLRLLFGLDDGRQHTYEEAGKVYGITRERVRQIKIKALKTIDKGLKKTV